MARYKHYCDERGKMIPGSFRDQILPGSFEYTLSYLFDHELDLSAFDLRYCNDDTGRPAYDPALLLKGTGMMWNYASNLTSLIGRRDYESYEGGYANAAWDLTTARNRRGKVSGPSSGPLCVTTYAPSLQMFQRT